MSLPYPPAEGQRRSRARRSVRIRPTATTAVLIAYIAAMLMTATDAQIVNVVLPTLSRTFSQPMSAVQWTVISYLLALAVLIPTSGWIADCVGTKQLFIIALGLFTFASALCGAVHSLPALIAARAIQGAGGGMLTPAATSMLYRRFPPAQRAKIARAILVPILLGPGSAPILGGALTEWLSWRWIFLINVPVGVSVLAFSWRFLPRTVPTGRERLDLPGMVLSGFGLSLLLFAVSQGATLGWASVYVLATGICGSLLLIGFAFRSTRIPSPILRIRLLGDRLFRATNVVVALSTGPFLASIYLAPIFLQNVLHQSPLSSGATTFLEAVGVGVGAQTLARLYPRFGPRVLATIGGIGLAVYLGVFVLVTAHTSLWLVRALMFFGGFADSGAFLASQTAMFTAISRHDMSHAAAIYNTNRQSAVALNIAIFTTIAAGTSEASITAFHSAFLAGAAIAAFGAICACTLIHTRDASATMPGR